MKTSDFFFELPESLIAQYPPEQRGRSRLMTLNRQTGKRGNRMVEELPEILCGPEFCGKSGELPLLVFNDSKVRKARLIGTSPQTGARAEFLLLEGTGNRWKCIAQRAKRRKIGSRYVFCDADGAEIARAEITGGEGEGRLLEFDRTVDDAWLDRYGHIPLPPYIKRHDAPADADRYQTVYAAVTGSAAAPTAGLHFTRALLDRLAAAGIESAFITLHVGPGTFLPVRSENIEDHVMHNESFTIDEQTAQKIKTAKAAGRKIVAVGSTSVRTLESVWGEMGIRDWGPGTGDWGLGTGDWGLGTGEFDLTGLSNTENSGNITTSKPQSANNAPRSPVPGPRSLLHGNTAIFIYPGYQFKVADALFTNFHTPESTLLMLVAAFAGRDLILESYAEAVGEGYRFFSYGDAMLIA
ncbi:MAG: S-adenosylmethionine:tRNA ribosyltransferase-isomerase [Treponema sp.]|jgi:S-adenosylmethionine:tRNA ribosyltransferase-isomerase|nr:S-adenosylmethionine:tRNA ribosyltransferase-isomerase [Treponema sp.]